MIENLTFLEEGPFTNRDENVKEKVNQIKEEYEERLLRGLSAYVSKIKYDASKKRKIFRKRTGSKIINDGYTTGCSDTALAFIVLAREAGIPTIFVDTLEESKLGKKFSRTVSGHVFVDIKFNDNWYKYEPKKGFIAGKNYALGTRKYVEIGRGLDFAQTFIKENGVYRPNEIVFDSINKLRKKANNFYK